MTRKDYIAIAEALANSRPDDYQQKSAAWIGWRRAKRAIADVLEADNPRFDRQRFYNATEGK